ncbi:glycosyltransferase [Ignatzschineria cameli]|uniref:Amylovoran biosynthesis protein AmsE n=1 Tax=Ignatzschineria cameli TaxID=2182793 RepID=A0A2U2AQL3_9GAMM|nr:glycosyltransferase [Ignatzschineria cameli]PWD86181.1 amylovoran biosynthesis protein AmsE [Ignatzschineria cameli]
MTASFSVLLSIYYKEDPTHFDEALTSIWDHQILKPNEIVLVKDGPLTPELDDVIKHWKQKLGDIFIVSALEKNEGTGRAKNHGLQLCNYEYIAIMDTDDISVSNRFQMQIEYLEKHPNIVVLGGQLQEFVGSLDNIISEKNVPLSHNDITSFSKNRSPFNHPTSIYKRKEITEIGGYKHHLFMEDYNLWIRVLSKGYQTANLPDILLYQRISNGMHGRRRGWQYIKSEWQMFKLKCSLKYQNRFNAFLLFLLKSSIRILPTSLLQKIYNTFLRKKIDSSN